MQSHSLLAKLNLQKNNETRILSEVIFQPNDSMAVFEITQMPDEGVLILNCANNVSYHIWKKNAGYKQQIEFDLQTLNPCPTYNAEQIAYAYLMDAYANYDSTFNHDHSKTRFLEPRIKSDYLAALYIANRRLFNKNLQQLFHHFPDSYAAKTAAAFLKFPETQAGQKPGYEFVHQQFFTLWNFKDTTCIQHPVCAMEIARYLDYFGKAAGENTIYSGINTLYNSGLTAAPKEVRDYFTDFLIIQFMQMPNNQGDPYLQYIYNQYIAGCNEKGTENHFIRSIPNMDKMKLGKILPNIIIPTEKGTSFDLYHSNQVQYTLVFLWKPHCPYCESLLPDLKKLARQYPTQLRIVAISLDNNAMEWKQITESHKKISNWTDLSEHKGFESPALSNFYFKGTPTVFLLNRDLQIVSRSVDPSQLEKIIDQKNN